jgi:hypothetical protein
MRHPQAACGAPGDGDGDGEIGLAARVATQASSSETQASIFGTATVNGSGPVGGNVQVHC